MKTAISFIVGLIFSTVIAVTVFFVSAIVAHYHAPDIIDLSGSIEAMHNEQIAYQDDVRRLNKKHNEFYKALVIELETFQVTGKKRECPPVFHGFETVPNLKY